MHLLNSFSAAYTAGYPGVTDRQHEALGSSSAASMGLAAVPAAAMLAGASSSSRDAAGGAKRDSSKPPAAVASSSQQDEPCTAGATQNDELRSGGHAAEPSADNERPSTSGRIEPDLARRSPPMPTHETVRSGLHAFTFLATVTPFPLSFATLFCLQEVKPAVVDPFDAVFGSREPSPDRGSQRGGPAGPSGASAGASDSDHETEERPPRTGGNALSKGVRRSWLSEGTACLYPVRPATCCPARLSPPACFLPECIVSLPREKDQSIVYCHAEDREDLRIFEVGVSSPTASHAAWSAAASSLQMRSALPEVHRSLAVHPGCFSRSLISNCDVLGSWSCACTPYIQVCRSARKPLTPLLYESQSLRLELPATL